MTNYSHGEKPRNRVILLLDALLLHANEPIGDAIIRKCIKCEFDDFKDSPVLIVSINHKKDLVPFVAAYKELDPNPLFIAPNIFINRQDVKINTKNIGETLSYFDEYLDIIAEKIGYEPVSYQIKLDPLQIVR
jgi:hypothetical protein